MKNLPSIGIALLVFLVLSTQVPATADVIEQAKQYFSEEEITQGQDFAYQRRWIFWTNALSQLALLVYLVFTPIGKRIYLACGEKVQNHWFAHLVLMGGLYFLASTAIGFPFRLAQYVLNVQWEMTNQSFFAWFGDYFLGLLVMALFDGAALFGFYAIVRYSPRIWWLIGGGAAVVFGFFVAFIVPDVVEPLFNTFTPISQTKWKTAEPRIRALGSDIGIGAASIWVVDASRQGVHSNAYFTGFGTTQRIVLYDNLLENHSADEVDTIIAHEMGHWYNQHILQGILLGGLALTGGLYLLYGYLNKLIEGGALRSASDPAGVFRVILLAQLAFAITLPVQNWVSRIMERQADEVSLNLSKNPRAFIAAEKRLAKLNKSNVAPSRWTVLLFASHPPVVERITTAIEWEAAEKEKKRATQK